MEKDGFTVRDLANSKEKGGPTPREKLCNGDSGQGGEVGRRNFWRLVESENTTNGGGNRRVGIRKGSTC